MAAFRTQLWLPVLLLAFVSFVPEDAECVEVSKSPTSDRSHQGVVIPADAFFSGQPGYPDRSAFTAVRWEKGTPHVRVDGRWCEYIAIDGVAIKDVWDFCKARLGGDAKKRFSEDHLVVLRLLGHKVGEGATLRLRDKQGQVVMRTVAVTRENRERLCLAGVAGQQEVKQSDWLSRALRRLGGSARRELPKRLTAEQVDEDLDFFEKRLRAQFAYLEANGVDLKAAVEAIRAKSHDGMSTKALALELQKVIASYIDGHAAVRGWRAEPRGYLPFLLEPAGDDVVAVRADRGSLVDGKYPYVARIDGKTLGQWSEELTGLIAEGSPQYVRYQACRHLRALQFCRLLAGLELRDSVEVELLSRDKTKTRSVVMPIASRRPTYGLWPRRPETREPAILPGEIGYLPIRSMSRDAVPVILEWMERFKETKGLIVDVRGNGGGTRAPLLALSPLLLSPADKPYVASVAKYRLYEAFADNHMDGRYMMRRDDRRLGQAERDAVDEFRGGFKPQWEPPAERFSPWHYLVISRRNLDRQGLGDYYYDRPVVVLHDQRCFSATDIFLGALKGRPNVTLMGTASGGGSAYSQRFRLPHSLISVKCASMASFQPSGRLYDTNGIEPDVEVVPSSEYFLIDGPDDVLEAALERLGMTKGEAARPRM